MQEEIEHKTVNFAISTAKLSARTLLRGAQFFLRQYDKSASQGKQSMKRLIRQNRGVTNLEIEKTGMMLLGTYRGFELNIRFDSFKNEHQIVLRGELSYPVPLGDDPRGNIVRLDNAIGNFADRIADAEAALDSLEQQKQAAEVEIAKPFAQEEELQTKSARLAELDALLNMEHQSSRTEPEAEEKPDARPSVLAALEEKADKVEPVRPFKSYLDKDGDAR